MQIRCGDSDAFDEFFLFETVHEWGQICVSPGDPNVHSLGGALFTDVTDSRGKRFRAMEWASLLGKRDG